MTKKFKKNIIILVTLLTIATLTGCGNKDFYPKEELQSENINMNVIDHYKKVFMDTDFFYCEDLAIQVEMRTPEMYVTLYELDSTGKALETHNVEGDLESDIYILSKGGTLDFVEYYENLKYDITLDEDGNIYGRRLMDMAALESYRIIDAEAKLIEIGCPDSEFSVNKEGDNYIVTYGKYTIKGDLEKHIIYAVFNGFPPFVEGYNFEKDNNVINTEGIYPVG